MHTVLVLACECIPLSHPSSPIYVCVCVCLTNKKRYSMLSSHPTSVRCVIEKGFITCSATLTVTCNFGVGVWVYSLVSSSFPYIYVCVCLTNKKRYSMLSSHPTSVRCDIEKGFITCPVTLIIACSFAVGVWMYSLVSSPFPYIYIYMCVCVCVCVFNK